MSYCTLLKLNYVVKMQMGLFFWWLFHESHLCAADICTVHGAPLLQILPNLPGGHLQSKGGLFFLAIRAVPPDSILRNTSKHKWAQGPEVFSKWFVSGQHIFLCSSQVHRGYIAECMLTSVSLQPNPPTPCRELLLVYSKACFMILLQSKGTSSFLCMSKCKHKLQYCIYKYMYKCDPK